MVPLSVALIFGGRSAEHEISIISAKSIAANINADLYRVIPIYITHDGEWFIEGIARDILNVDLAALLRNTSLDAAGETLRRMTKEAGQHPFDRNFTATGIDVAFLVLHGSYGEDGRIQGFLDTCSIPYTGCGVLASALTMDKALTKLCVADAGIAVAPGISLLSSDYHADPETCLARIESGFDYPLFIKPANLGSSVGISKVHHRSELPAALETACRVDTKVLVEKAIKGREIEVAILGNENPFASLCGEIEPGSDFYDYEDKYIHNSAKTFIPARISSTLQERVQSAAIRAYKALGCRGMSRVDFFVDEEPGTIILNEVNTIPGFTDISMYPQLMEATGIPFNELTGKLLQLAMEKRTAGNASAVQRS
ncbi:MAG: D-alanine--D-alanine ligase [Chlorobiaceae bacterium]|nr:D-alanine--D-alanine ligase [Chlorobiaceae bacterium]